MAVTALRARYARALGLSLVDQTRECIDYLQNPEVLVAEFCDSFLMAEAVEHQDESFPSAETLPAPRRAPVDAAVARVSGAARLRVSGAEAYEFSYVARDLVPLCSRGSAAGAAAAGLDYVGLTLEASATPLLGVVSATAAAPFAALLRVLACLAEVGSDAQLERANRFVFKGALVGRVPFDLHLLWVSGAEPPSPGPLGPLTRDLASVFSDRLREEWTLPPLVRHILCLRMPAAQEPFDGALTESWCV
jgi:hypothetical protein